MQFRTGEVLIVTGQGVELFPDDANVPFHSLTNDDVLMYIGAYGGPFIKVYSARFGAGAVVRDLVSPLFPHGSSLKKS